MDVFTGKKNVQRCLWHKFNVPNFAPQGFSAAEGRSVLYLEYWQLKRPSPAPRENFLGIKVKYSEQKRIFKYQRCHSTAEKTLTHQVSRSDLLTSCTLIQGCTSQGDESTPCELRHNYTWNTVEQKTGNQLPIFLLAVQLRMMLFIVVHRQIL
jgi:hypothetical protein